MDARVRRGHERSRRAEEPAPHRLQEGVAGATAERRDDQRAGCAVPAARALPRPLRAVCHAIIDSCRTMLPGKETAFVAAFFLLRFLNPALVTPDHYDLLARPLTLEERSVR